MNGQKLKITYRGYGIADRFEDGSIELNRHLEKYPKLRRAIILHELKHTDNPKVNKRDFVHDLSTLEQLRMRDMLKFMIRHPSSLVQFIPIYYNKRRGLIIDKNLLLIYGIFSIFILVGLYFGFTS